jgi:predicted protein tyrosine phosphatase
MIHVSSLRAAQGVIDHHDIHRVVSILGPETPHRRFHGVAHENHLQLTFNDISAAMEGMQSPAVGHVETLLKFVQGWGQNSPMLIHCWAGVSRSTAAAYITQCALEPQADESKLAKRLRAISPSATPNRMMVRLADEILNRGGRMEEAIAAIGRGADAFEGGPFRWDLRG